MSSGLESGFTSTQYAPTYIQQIAEEVRRQLETKMGKRFAVYDAIQFRGPTDVIGIPSCNIIKVHVAYEKDGYVHVKTIAPPLENPQSSLDGYQPNKTLDDPIEVF